MDRSKALIGLASLLGLIVVVFLAIYVRSGTLDSPTVLDYDPWWFFRHAETIVENDYNVPEWDTLSYYPPGRPTEPFQGWPYTIAYLYKIINGVSPATTLVDIAKISPLIMAGLTVVVSFLFGIFIFKNWIAGLALGLFATLAPTFIGVSMAGYSDSDALAVFYTILTFFSFFLLIQHAHKKWKSLPFYLFAIISNLLFIFNWGGGWLPSIIMTVAIPAIFFYRIFENAVHQRKLEFNWKHAFHETKPIAVPLLITIAAINVIGFMLGFTTMFHTLLGGLGFTGIAGEPLIVNISVAELQRINIFTKQGFLTIADRIGMLPTMLTFFTLFPLLVYKFYKRQKITFFEISIVIWTLITFYLISTGVRFALFFSIATSLVAAYVLANLSELLKNRNMLLTSSIYGVLLIFLVIFISTGMKVGYASGGLSVSNNWYDALDWLKTNADKDSLVSTWWDPGHIIAGYTGLKVHADGAHCGVCTPYNHNVRIRDMGRLMSTNNESESIQILKKYIHLTDEQCNTAREKFGDKMPAEACKDTKEVYVLATNDLIGKYFWMSCFGSFNMERWKSGIRDVNQLCQGRNFIQIPFTNTDNSGLPIYSNDFMTVTLLQNNTDLLSVINVPSQGVRNVLVSDVVFYQNGLEQTSHASTSNSFDGMIWIDPSFRAIIFMDSSVRDSVFTKMFFFNGRGLNDFELVFSNQEVKIYKAKI